MCISLPPFTLIKKFCLLVSKINSLNAASWASLSAPVNPSLPISLTSARNIGSPSLTFPCVTWNISWLLSIKEVKPSSVITVPSACALSTVNIAKRGSLRVSLLQFQFLFSPFSTRLAVIRSTYSLFKPSSTTPNTVGYIPPTARTSKVNNNSSLPPTVSIFCWLWHSVTFKSYSNTTSLKSSSYHESSWIGQPSSNITTPVLW